MVDVFKRAGANNREASQEDVCLGVGKGSQTIIVLLACSVPEVQADKLSTNAQVFRVVVKPVWVCGCVWVSGCVVAIMGCRAMLVHPSMEENLHYCCILCFLIEQICLNKFQSFEPQSQQFRAMELHSDSLWFTWRCYLQDRLVYDSYLFWFRC